MDNDIKAAIIKELNIQDLPPEAQDQIIAQLGEIILQGTTVTVLESLSPEKRKEFEVVGEEGDPKKIQDFLVEHAPNLQQIMEQELKKVIELFKQGEDVVAEKTEE